MKRVLIIATTAMTLAGCQTSTQSSAPKAVPVVAKAASISDPTAQAVRAFIEACVKTAASPNAAPQVLKSLGFKSNGVKKGRMSFSAPFGTASVSKSKNGGLGQCVVTPKSASFSTVVSQMRSAVPASGVPTRKLGNEEAWLVGNTGSVVLISRKKGAMTRTQPNVFRG